jgi:pilus assembly protein Flp/PilA
MANALRRLVSDDSGAATTEYAVVLGLLVVAAIAIISQVGPRVLASWAAIEHKLDGEDSTTIVVTRSPGDH